MFLVYRLIFDIYGTRSEDPLKSEDYFLYMSCRRAFTIGDVKSYPNEVLSNTYAFGKLDWDGERLVHIGMWLCGGFLRYCLLQLVFELRVPKFGLEVVSFV